jgi:hypothetical protein
MLREAALPEPLHLFATGQQFIQFPHIYNRAILEHDDLVSLTQRGVPVRNHQTGDMGTKSTKKPLSFCLLF